MPRAFLRLLAIAATIPLCQAARAADSCSDASPGSCITQDDAQPHANITLGTPSTGTAPQSSSVTLCTATGAGCTVLSPSVVGSTVTVTFPNTSGTVAANASSPLALSSVTGTLTCPTCATTTNGGAITGTSPISVSPSGAISLGIGSGLTTNVGNIVLGTPTASTLGGVESLTCSANNWMSSLSTGGVFSCSQPPFSSISGTIASGQVSGSYTGITGVGTLSSGTWSASIIGLAYGGTNASLTASNGGIAWSNASQLQILAGTSTANQMLLSGASTSPSWSTATYPATAAQGTVLSALSANTITATVTPVLGNPGVSTGTLSFGAAGGGTTVLTPQTVAGTVTVTLPSVSGTLASLSGGYLLSSQMPALTGDVTSSAGSALTAVGKINGVALGSTAATAGNVLVGSGTQWVSVAVSGDCTLASSGAVTCTKTNGVPFGSLATLSSVPNSNLANMPPYTFKGNGTASAGAPSDLTGAQAEQLMQFTQSGSGATQRTLDAKMKEVQTSVTDYGAICDNTGHALSAYYGSLTAAQAVYPFVTSLSQTIDFAAAQLAINDLPSYGGTVVVPLGAKCVLSNALELAGTSGNKTGVTIQGQRGSSWLIMQGGSGNTNNLIEALYGSGHRVRGLELYGDAGAGSSAVAGPTKGFWAPSTAYAVNDTVEVSSTNTQTSTVAASNLVYKCNTANTSSAAFSTDLAKWTSVSDPNLNTSDLSYRYRNGIYVSGASDVQILDNLITNFVYAGINLGSGPVQPANITAAASNIQVLGNRVAGNTSGIAGGYWTDVVIANNDFRDNSVYGVVEDAAVVGVTINANTFVSAATALDAVYIYSATDSTVSANIIRGWTNGVVLASGATRVSITGNQIVSPKVYGIYAAGLTSGAIGSNVVDGSTSGPGIHLESAYGAAITGNSSYGNATYGIDLLSVSGLTVTGNTVISNGSYGIAATSSVNGSITGNMVLNNGGPGIYGNNSSTWAVSGNIAYDSRGSGSKTQTYGIQTAGTSTGWTLSANNLAGNATSDYSLAGANYALANSANEPAKKIGSAVAAATTPANFSGQTVITITDAQGTTRYVPAMNSAW